MTCGNMSIHHIQDYGIAHVSIYFAMLLLTLFFGIIINTLHPICNFVDSIETKAAEFVKMPRMTPPTKRKFTAADKESPLLQKDGKIQSCTS